MMVFMLHRNSQIGYSDSLMPPLISASQYIQRILSQAPLRPRRYLFQELGMAYASFKLDYYGMSQLQ